MIVRSGDLVPTARPVATNLVLAPVLPIPIVVETVLIHRLIQAMGLCQMVSKTVTVVV